MYNDKPDFVTDLYQIRVNGFSSEDGPQTMNAGSLAKKIKTYEDLIYLMKVVSGVVDRASDNILIKNSTSLAVLDASVVLKTKVKNAIIESWNVSKGKL